MKKFSIYDFKEKINNLQFFNKLHLTNHLKVEVIIKLQYNKLIINKKYYTKRNTFKKYYFKDTFGGAQCLRI